MMTVEQVIECISKMIASGDIPNEVYDKYLSKCPIGFMNEDDLFNYLMSIDGVKLEKFKNWVNDQLYWDGDTLEYEEIIAKINRLEDNDD